MASRFDAWCARRDERRALLASGRQLPPSPAIAALDQKVRGFDQALDDSMRRDRADYAAVPAWARGLVVLRGVLDRAVLRALRLSLRRERDEACIALAAGQPSPEVLQARARREAAENALGPLPLPLRESAHFGRFLARELRTQLVPRVPALVGLVVGWWIAQTFTDSELSATLHSWGIGDGPRHAVRSSTLKAMSFALPIVAAAVCSYAGSRLAAYFRARYAPRPEVE
ncbi:MAG TPA: hypothetical protein VLW85_25065 [Myxococcales bacterium]|nr:hypothetical protein [Myxococcales bacterium]